jgi:hypothetical protein
MNVEVSATPHAIQDKPGSMPKHVGTKFKALKNQVEVAMTGMEFMTITDWTALRQEIHQKLQELKQSDGCWRKAKSDLETKIAALEESIRLSNSSPVDILARFQRSAPEQERPTCWAGGARTNALWAHKGAKQLSTRPAA